MKRFIHIILLGLILSLIASIIILASTPPTSKDALIHHLAVPKLWIKHGGFYNPPFMSHSYYPMNIELLYLIPLMFENDIVPKYIHFSFAVLIAILIYFYLKRKINNTFALLGVLIFLSTPIIIKLSTTAYVDLGLLFFSTLSLLTLLRWQEEDFKTKWLIISAISCGLALGTKYNGLVVLFLLTLAVPYLYIRNNKNSSEAIKYGLFYFAISLIVFSPWITKNYLLTGNPIYPFYESIFSATNVNSGNHLGVFQIRKLVYGETWWEIVLIPVRIFFTGEDGSPRQFDGVLNPILLIFLPFSFLNGRNRKEKDVKCLSLFAILYFLIAFFRADMRIRYILPILTPLAILTVYGIKNACYLRDKASKVLCISICGFLLGLNATYIHKQFRIIQPFSYITGRVSRDEYLGKRLGNYEVMKFINKHLPEDAKIMFLFMGNRGYYCDRDYVYDTYYSGITLKDIIQRSKSIHEIRLALKEMKITHLLMNNRLTWEFLHNNLGRDRENLFSHFMMQDAKLLFTHHGYFLYELVGSSGWICK